MKVVSELTPPKIACISCRRKRVKCDKLRPACTKCTKSGRECLYHEPKKTGPKPKKKREEHPIEEHPIEQLHQQPVQHISPVYKLIDSPMLVQQPFLATSLHTSPDSGDTPPSTIASDTEATGLSTKEAFAQFFDPNKNISQIILRPKFERNYYSGEYIYGIAGNLIKAIIYHQKPKLAAVSERLYFESLKGLDAVERTTTDSSMHLRKSVNSIAHLQAWILICEYECHTNRLRNCSINMARSIRMAQHMELDTLDAEYKSFPSAATMFGDECVDEEETSCFPPWILKEEKRRTFWYLYVIERCFISIAGPPIFYAPEFIYTKMPMLYSDFSSGTNAEMGFMKDALDKLKTGEVSLDAISALALQMATVGKFCVWNREFEAEPFEKLADPLHLETLKKQSEEYETILSLLHAGVSPYEAGSVLSNMIRIVGTLSVYHILYERFYQVISSHDRTLPTAITDYFDFLRRKNLVYLYLLIDACNDVKTSEMLMRNPFYTVGADGGIRCAVGIVDNLVLYKSEFELPRDHIEDLVGKLQQTAESLRNSTKRLEINPNDYFPEDFKDTLAEFENLLEICNDWIPTGVGL